MDWTTLATHLHGVAHLATASPQGDPHVSAVWPLVDGEGLWIFTTAGSGKARCIAANDRVAIMWQESGEAYVWGSGRLVTDLETKRRLWSRDDLPFDPAAFFGSAENPNHVLVRVTPARATLMTHDAGGIQRATWRG